MAEKVQVHVVCTFAEHSAKPRRESFVVAPSTLIPAFIDMIKERLSKPYASVSIFVPGRVVGDIAALRTTTLAQLKAGSSWEHEIRAEVDEAQPTAPNSANAGQAAASNGTFFFFFITFAFLRLDF